MRNLNQEIVKVLGDELYEALRKQQTVRPLTERYADMTLEDAYHISLMMLENRLVRDGEKIIGKKIGVTSAAVQNMLGVHQPDFGFLTDKMLYANNSTVVIAGNLIQPRSEAEIAFKLKKTLRGPGVSQQDVLEASACIIPCFEIVDSRIDNWKIKIQDTIADNASCGVYVLGDAEADPRDFHLPDLRVEVFKNGRLISEGLGSAVQGNPLAAVAWLANTLAQFGISLEAGDTILSGSLVPLEPAQPGDHFSLKIAGLGTAALSFI